MKFWKNAEKNVVNLKSRIGVVDLGEVVAKVGNLT